MKASASRQVLAMTLASLAAAVIALLVFVLPAEFDLDPTGLGARLGIKGMAGYQVSALSPSNRMLRSDHVEFPLAPFESIEYKYRLEAGEALVYSWDAGSEVVYDMHSDPDDGSRDSSEGHAGEDEAVGFAAGRAAADQGTFVAPFPGIHGWFWENRSSEEVVVRLHSSGFYSAASVFGPNGEYKRDLSAAQPAGG